MPGRVLSNERVSEDDSDSESLESGKGRSVQGTRSSERSSASLQPKKRTATATPTRSAKRSKTSHAQTPEVDATDSSSTSSESESGKTGIEESSPIESVDDESEVEEEEEEVEAVGGASRTHPSHVTSRVSRLFERSDGFERTLPTSRTNAALEHSLFSSNLSSKQLWHITAPASVSLSSISEIASTAAMTGERVVTHHDISYGFVSNNSVHAKRLSLLVSKDGGQSYRTASTSFQEYLQLQQITPLSATSFPPNTSKASLKFNANVQTPAMKEVRHQPEGLRTRFWPLGFEK